MWGGVVLYRNGLERGRKEQSEIAKEKKKSNLNLHEDRVSTHSN